MENKSDSDNNQVNKTYENQNDRYVAPRTSHYGQILHPNDEQSEFDSHFQTLQVRNKGANDRKSMQMYKERVKKDCSYYFMKLDFEILKPLLIYKFDREKMNKEDQFADIMMSDANMLGSVYG